MKHHDAVVGPMQFINPEAAEMIMTADYMHSAYGRRRLSVYPLIPAVFEDVVIPDEYKLSENDHRFLLWNVSFASILNGPVDNHILGFGSKKFFKKLCSAKTIHLDCTFKVCPAPFSQLVTFCSFHHDKFNAYGESENIRMAPRIYFLHN